MLKAGWRFWTKDVCFDEFDEEEEEGKVKGDEERVYIHAGFRLLGDRRHTRE